MKKYTILLLFLNLIYCNKSPVEPENTGLDWLFLTSAEMPGFELATQNRHDIAINDKWEVHEGIGQKWLKVTEDDSEFYHITYCEFNTSAEAFQGIAYCATRGNAWPYIWDSLNGSIIQDGSWIEVNYGSALFFIRGNIGIRIGCVPGLFNEQKRQILLGLCTKLQKKIETKLSYKIRYWEENARQKQIQYTDYQLLTNSAINSEIMNGFSPYSYWDSKWFIDSENFAMGIRKEWKNNEGSVVGIDICKFDSQIDGKKAGELMSYNTWRDDRLFQLDDLDTLKQILNNWQYIAPETNYTVVAYKNNLAYHVYCNDSTGVDSDFYYTLFEKLSKQ